MPHASARVGARWVSVPHKGLLSLLWPKRSLELAAACRPGAAVDAGACVQKQRSGSQCLQTNWCKGPERRSPRCHLASIQRSLFGGSSGRSPSQSVPYQCNTAPPPLACCCVLCPPCHPESTARQSEKMGMVVFQFQLGFKPSEENRQRVLECRQRLSISLSMAVEFRFVPLILSSSTRLCTCTAHTIVCSR